MRIEDRLDAFREQRPVCRFDALRLAAAVPEAALRRRDSRRRPCDAKKRFSESGVCRRFVGCCSLILRCIAQCCVTYSRRHLRPADDQLADFARRQFLRVVDRRNRLVGDANHAPLDRIKLPADAHASAFVRSRRRFAEHFGRFDRGHRQALRRPVRRVHLRTVAQRTPASAAARRPAPGHRTKTLAAAIRSARPSVAQCSLTTRHTAGDANACVTCQSFAAASSFRGSADAGREKSISRKHGRHAHRRIEQREQRKARQVDAARLDAVRRLNLATCVSNMRCV